MKYDFDTVVSRESTNSYKWSFFPEDLSIKKFVYTDRYFEPGGPIPMWVADMDFKTAKPIIDALVERASHGIFGYTGKSPAYFKAVCHWMKKKHNWDIRPEWIVATPGIFSAIHMLINTFTDVSEKVVITSPIYFPFVGATLKNGRQPLSSPLKFENRRYILDFEDIEKKARDPLAKIMFLCNPHNPVGRVWSKEELIKVGEICLKNNVVVISDEVHLDIIYEGYKYTPFASISNEFALNSVTCTSANKTFNLGGLQAANIIIPNERLRKAFELALSKNGFEQLNPFGLAAVEAAYNDGEEWLGQCLEYLEENLNFMDNYLKEKLPEVELVRPEGTYLAWLDFRKLGMYKDELHNFLIEKARVVFDDGYVFGEEGDGFQRLNFACPRIVLEEALNRMEKAIHSQSQGKSDNTSDWFYPEQIANAPYNKPIVVRDTDGALGRYNIETKEIGLKELARIHGHLCDGLVIAFVEIKAVLEKLFPDGVVDRTDICAVSKNGPCWADTVAFMTGARINFTTLRIENSIGNGFIIQRISTGQAYKVHLKPGVFPPAQKELEDKIRSLRAQGKPVVAEDIDEDEKMADDLNLKLLSVSPGDLLQIEKLEGYKFQFCDLFGMRGDIINKDMPRQV